jgi:hypothetical protein
LFDSNQNDPFALWGGTPNDSLTVSLDSDVVVTPTATHPTHSLYENMFDLCTRSAERERSVSKSMNWLICAGAGQLRPELAPEAQRSRTSCSGAQANQSVQSFFWAFASDLRAATQPEDDELSPRITRKNMELALSPVLDVFFVVLGANAERKRAYGGTPASTCMRRRADRCIRRAALHSRR